MLIENKNSKPHEANNSLIVHSLYVDDRKTETNLQTELFHIFNYFCSHVILIPKCATLQVVEIGFWGYILRRVTR